MSGGEKLEFGDAMLMTWGILLEDPPVNIPRNVTAQVRSGASWLCGGWLSRPLGAGFLKALVCSYVLSCGIVFAVVIVIIVADVGVSLHDIPFNQVLTADVNVTLVVVID